MKRWKMLARVVSKAVWHRPAKLAATLGALTVAATLSSAFLSLYFALPGKLSGEFKSLGANLVIAPRENGETFSAELLARLAEKEPQVASVPWLYAVGQTGDGNVVMAGTEFARLAAVSPGWKIRTAASGKDEPLVKESLPQLESGPGLLAGEKAAEHFGWALGQTVALSFGGRTVSLPLRAVLTTGGSEDSQAIVPLASLQELTGQPGKLSLIQARAEGASAEIEARRKEIAALLPELDARPLLQVVESEARVVMKVRALMYGLTAVVLVIVILSVMTTVGGLVLDRQKDIGIMKTMGGSDAMISFLFVAETALIAICAAALGHWLGFALADWAARGLFHSSLGWRWDVLGSVTAVTLAVALIAASIPIRVIRNLEPAAVLKGL
jgi:putative ABC transport system permease protein